MGRASGGEECRARWFAMQRLIAVMLLVVPMCGLLGCRALVSASDEQAFRENLGTGIRLSVYPTIVRRENVAHDPESARRIANWFESHGLGRARLINQNVEIDGPWRINQSRMFRESVRSFEEHLESSPLDSHYGVMAEYLMGGGTRVVGIHLYVIDPAGSPTFTIGLNSHDRVFELADPRSVEDCTALLISELEAEFLPN